jgi:hypothetical protein
MEIRANCCGGFVGLGRVGKNVLPEGIEPSTFIIMILIAGNDHDLLTSGLWAQLLLSAQECICHPIAFWLKLLSKQQVS